MKTGKHERFDISSHSNHVCYRIFHLRYALPTAELSTSGIDDRFDIACVRVDIRSNEDRNDLVSCLSAQLGLDSAINGSSAYNDVSEKPHIFQPSEVIAFNLTRLQPEQEPRVVVGPQPKQAKDDRGPFRFPKSVYLDQFLTENAQLAASRRAERKGMLKDVEDLVAKRETLTHFEVSRVITFPDAPAITLSQGSRCSQ